MACECSCEASLDLVESQLNPFFWALHSDVNIVTPSDPPDAPSKGIPMHTSPKSQLIPLNSYALDFRPTNLDSLPPHSFVKLERRITESHTVRLPSAIYIDRPYLDPCYTSRKGQWSTLNPYLLDFIPTSVPVYSLSQLHDINGDTTEPSREEL